MSTTIVCQNLDFCIKKLATPDHSTTPPHDQVLKSNLEFNTWNFLKTPPNKESLVTIKESTFYTSTKNPSFPKLSAESLELCTENLGSETGTDNITDDESSISTFSYSKKSSWPGKLKERESFSGKSKNFPPPLTSMSGLEVRRRTEGGRLIIEAVESPFKNSYLQAERCDGRLRMCFLKSTVMTDSAGGEKTKEKEVEENEVELVRDEFDGEISVEMENVVSFRSRCKEEGGHGNEGLLCRDNWKPAVWIVTS